jgi:hypothetical protein
MEMKSKRSPATDMEDPDEHVAIDNIDKQHVVHVGADEISVHDVVLGRGSAIALYPGNENFRRLVAFYRDEYHHTKRHSKHTTGC